MYNLQTELEAKSFRPYGTFLALLALTRQSRAGYYMPPLRGLSDAGAEAQNQFVRLDAALKRRSSTATPACGDQKCSR